MKSKTSSFNRGIFLNDLKRFSWLGIAYFVALFFTLPLRIYMQYSEDINRLRWMRHIFDIENIAFLILSVPVLIGILLLRYLQVKKNSDFVHSLPVKREKIFSSNIVIGIILLVVPIILNALLAMILNVTLDLGNYFTIKDILLWAEINIAINVFVFMITIFAGIISGITILQGILTYIFMFLPAGISLLILTNLKYLLYGFRYDSIIENTILKFSPVVRMLSYSYHDMKQVEILIYILICVFFYFLSRFLYKKRSLETATNSIVFNKLKPVFKYGVTLSTMLLGGIYFGETQNKNIYWTLFGYIIGSLIGYIIAEIILKKSFKAFKNLKGYLIYLIVIVLVLVGMKFDITGYESYVPDIDNISSMYFGNNYYQYNEMGYIDNLGFKEEENIKNIYALHKIIIKDKNKYINKIYGMRNFIFTYELKNGKKVTREYSIRYEDYSKYLKPIYESKEYKILNNSIFTVDTEKTDKLTIRPNANVQKSVILIDNSEIKEALDILKSDILNESYEEMNMNIGAWSQLELLLNNDVRVYSNWKKNYKEFEKWLSEKGYLENVRVMPEDISYVRVQEFDEKDNDLKYREYETVESERNDKRVLRIRDKQKIDILLRTYTDNWTENRKYHIEFFNERDEQILSGTYEDDAPDFIVNYFNNLK